ncbi:MAG: Hint domain-containing protein [Paracoccaceae bacterium]
MQFDRQDYRHDFGGLAVPLVAPETPTRAAPRHCFAPDARIATLMGEREIDSLVPGQMVLTNSGPRCPKVTRLTQTDDSLVCRVPAGAFGPNVPLHDLWLSPDQPIALRLDQTVPGRVPVTHRLTNLLTMFGSETGATPRVMPMPGAMIQLDFDQPAVVYISGLPVQIGDTDL